MKNFNILVLTILSTIALTACGDSGKRDFVGEWLAIIGNQKFVLRLESNGSGTATFEGNTDQIQWASESTKVIITLGEHDKMTGHLTADKTEIKFAKPPMTFRKN